MNSSDILKRLWECRDLEIEHYWHRMVFMTAFLVLAYACYGGFIELCLGEKTKISFRLFNLIAIGISLVGIVVSSLWIMMSKGSKAWQEQYEEVIKSFCRDKTIQPYLFKELDSKNNEILKYASGCYENISDCNHVDIDDFLWSTKAGGYSVSRIGIFIGQFSFVIWSILLLIHLILFLVKEELTKVSVIVNQIPNELIILLCGFALITFWIITKLKIKSGFLKK